jgi:hypothetical protein
MSYKGHFSPKNLAKYNGEQTPFYRSLWERRVFNWCDTSSDVASWSSETVIVPYLCKTDGKAHRYFVDLKITFNDGKTILVEIKPFKQTQPPKKRTHVTRPYLAEVLTWAKNTSKWEAAKEYAEVRGWEFKIWDEIFLKENLGITTVGSLPRYKRKKKA